MTPFWSDDHLTLFGGDCRAVMADMPAESVHCVVTSPPYWGLRDYGTATWDGGDAECDHALPRRRTYGPADAKEAIVSPVRPGDPGNLECARCGAERVDGQLGLEPTPEAYVAAMVDVFREVRRVMRPDATLWLNLGDSYANDTKWGGSSGGKHVEALHGQTGIGRQKVTTGLKAKDLVGIPWRVAFALQADGWYLRSDIIWSKPNPMPESVTDRPTKAHEYLFLLSKAPRYYFDADAVAERAIRAGDIPGGGHGYSGDGANDGRTRLGMATAATRPVAATRNIRSVWTIATEPYPGAHFATFPRKLVEPCVKAGTSERGVCPECGAPWARETTKEVHPSGNGRAHIAGGDRTIGQGWEGVPRASLTVETTGWRPTCAHDAEPVPATILDPFAGSGTTLLVAQALGRRGVGIDLSPEYLQQALARNAQTPLGLVG